MGDRGRVSELLPGSVVWVDLDPTVGREQAGRRPALVVAGPDYLEIVDTLALIVPITTVDRGWPNHVRVNGSDLEFESWAMTEQIRTIARARIHSEAGHADATTFRDVRTWIRDFLDL